MFKELESKIRGAFMNGSEHNMIFF